MIKEYVSLDYAITFLNECLKLDSEAITQLVCRRVPCNNDMINHPSIQVALNGVGFLGILNGLFGVFDEGEKNNFGAILAIFDDNNVIVRFERSRQ